MGRDDETGKCTKCARRGEIERATTDAERQRLQVICIRCIRNCDRCKHGLYLRICRAVMQHLSEKPEPRSLAELESESREISTVHCKSCKKQWCGSCEHHLRKQDIKGVIAAETKGVTPYVTKDELRAHPEWLNPRTGKVTIPPLVLDFMAASAQIELIHARQCAKCTRCPNDDDNPSHGGKHVVSFDAVDKTDADSPAPDKDSPLADIDPTYGQVSPKEADQGFTNAQFDLMDDPAHDPRSPEMRGESPESQPPSRAPRRLRPTVKDTEYKNITARLSVTAEEALVRELATYRRELSLRDMLLVSCLLKGISLIEFGEMKWVPEDLLKVASKQTVSQQFKRIIKSMPTLVAVAHGQIARGKGGKGRERGKVNPKTQARLDAQPSLFDFFGGGMRP